MSLLLDALKKAADDKQKKSGYVYSSATKEVAGTGEVSANIIAEEKKHRDKKITGKQSAGNMEPSELSLVSGNSPDAEELTLDPIDDEVTESSVQTDSNAFVEETDDRAQDQPDKRHSNDKLRDKEQVTISDEALSLLIHNTNHEVNRSRKLFLISVIIASLTVLLVGGLYYYYDTQAEIAAIERKHRIMMQSMRTKTSGEKTPEELKAIQNLVSDKDIDTKVQLAKQQVTKKQHTSKQQASKSSRPVRSAVNVNNTGKKQPVSALSISRTNKVDPVGEKLDAAWTAYQATDYSKATELYRQVLHNEENNRDALLGLGAIAIIEKDRRAAVEIYQKLLRLDPRDPIANAALVSVRSEESSLESDRERIQSMLEKNPDASHLNFSLANIYARQNKWKLAQQYYFNAWQHDTENPDYIFNLAVSLDHLNKNQQAIRFYQDSLLKSSNGQVGFSREAVEKRIMELSGL